MEEGFVGIDWTLILLLPVLVGVWVGVCLVEDGGCCCGRRLGDALARVVVKGGGCWGVRFA